MAELLVVLGGYYPSYNAPGIVFEKIIPELRKRFSITVVTPHRVNHRLGSHFNYNGVEVYEVSDFIQDKCVVSNGVSYKFWRVIQAFVRFVTRRPLFIFNVKKTLMLCEKLHKEKKFNAVLTVSFPPYAHEVGMALKRRHSEINWVAYSTDTLFEHQQLKSWIWGLALRKVLKTEISAYRNADAVFFTPEIFESRERMFPNKKVTPYKLEYPLIVPSRLLNNCASHDSIEIMFAGAFYEKIRNPQWFTMVMRKVIVKLPNVRFNFYLVHNACRECIESVRTEFPANVIIHKPVLPDEAKRLMRESDVLLNFANDVDQFSPSKTFDYIATGRPIINVVYPNRVLNEALKKHPQCLSVTNDMNIEDTSNMVCCFINKVAGSQMTIDDIKKIWNEYLPENTLKELVSVLSKR